MLTDKRTVGARVRPSRYRTDPARDYWCNQGEYTRKTRAKAELDRLLTLRGTVTEVLHNGLKVEWEDGTTSQCLDYMVELA